MATPQANIGELVDIRPSGAALSSSQRTILLRAEQVEFARLVVAAGKEIPEHKAKGEIVVQCLEGRVAYNVFGKTLTLEPGKLLYMPMGEPHSVKGIEDATLLLTISLAKQHKRLPKAQLLEEIGVERSKLDALLEQLSSEGLLPSCHVAGKALVQTGQPTLLFDLGELARHVGVVGLAHHPLGHAEQDVVLLENVLPQQGDVFPDGIGKRVGVEGLRLARFPHPAHAVTPQDMLVEHHANWPALFGDATLLEDREEHVFFLGVMALVGKLLEEPGCPLREAFGEGLPRFEAGHGPFQQPQATFDQVVFSFQAFDAFHDIFSLTSCTRSSVETPSGTSSRFCPRCPAFLLSNSHVSPNPPMRMKGQGNNSHQICR